MIASLAYAEIKGTPSGLWIGYGATFPTGWAVNGYYHEH